MSLAIIADDLTGANDSGVQLAKYGLKTSVLLKRDADSIAQNDAIVFDTDTRAMDGEEAQQTISSITKFLKENEIKHIYKKIDSTMRGNVGKEIVGFHEELQTDFIFLAVAYPKNGRQVIHGNHYLNGKLLAETEIANDPLSPVHESHIPTFLQEQTNRKFGLIDLDELRAGQSTIQKKLEALKADNIQFVVVDSEQEDDLKLLLDTVQGLDYSIGWVGSAGLANYLPSFLGIEQKRKQFSIPKQDKPILTVVGSVNITSRNQLKSLLKERDVVGIQMESYRAVSNERTKELNRIYNEAEKAAKQGLDVVIYSSGESADIELARKVGKENGFNHMEISKKIVRLIGQVAARLLEENHFQGIVMTGGDTAKSICGEWDAAGFELHDELEVGVPISNFIGKKNFFAITKAGGFGQEQVFIDAIRRLKGDTIHE